MADRDGWRTIHSVECPSAAVGGAHVDEKRGRGRTMLIRHGLAIVIVGLSSFLAACSGDDDSEGDTDPSAGVEGPAGLCANLQLLSKSLDRVQNFEPSTTLTEAEDARKEVDFALAELSEAETNVPTRQLAQLQRRSKISTPRSTL